MPNTLKVQNFYTTKVTSESVASSGDVNFTVSSSPINKNGFIVLSTENIPQREIMYYHDVIGNTIYVRGDNRGLGGTTSKEHEAGESVTMKDVAEIFNFYSDSISTCFYVEKIGGLNIKVWGGIVYYNITPQNVPDTNLVLTNNTINYIKYDYTSNTISVDQTDSGIVKAIVTVVSGVITSIGYRTAKESYIDFSVTLNGALPPQPGNAGKFLQTDGTNASWGTPAGEPNAGETVKGVVEVATLAQSTAGTDTGETGAQLVSKPSDTKALYAPIEHTHNIYNLVKTGTPTTLSITPGVSDTGDFVSGSTGILLQPTIARIALSSYGLAGSSVRLYRGTDNITFATQIYTYSGTSLDFPLVLEVGYSYRLFVRKQYSGSAGESISLTYTT